AGTRPAARLRSRRPEYLAPGGGARVARRRQLQTAELRLGRGDDAWLLQRVRTGRANSEFSIAPMFAAVQAGLDSVNTRRQGPSCPASRGKIAAPGPRNSERRAPAKRSAGLGPWAPKPARAGRPRFSSGAAA